MSFISQFFRSEKKSESVVLIDISANSIAGAYAHYREGEPPLFLYARRLPIEIHKGEPLEQSMLHMLTVLVEMLIREGAPLLARATGSGSADAILVSIDAPWQKTSIRIENFEQKDPFIFTKSLVISKLEKTSPAVPGKLLTDESIIGTILNGYETTDPYGRRVHRASVVVLTSLIDEGVAGRIVSTLRSLYHTTHILPIAGSSLRFQSMRRVFPHERDALILDTTGSRTSLALVRKNLFVALIEIAESADDASSLMRAVATELAELAKHYPLPRTIFLLAHEPDVASLRKALDVAKLGELWLSDNPPKIVPVLASHLTGLVQQTAEASPDLLLLLMTLYWQQRA